VTEAVPGCQGQVSLLVGGTDLAPALGSGSVPVLATWRIVALFEQAAHEAISASVGEESTTVARQVQIDHLSPVAEGAVVEAEAALERIEGRRLVFSCRARSGERLVAAGRLVRVVVDVKRFMTRAR
jgi:fluoroacetyl-CoA thioesterase